jgi:hypothetical protein
MPFRMCPREDPFTSRVRRTYRCNIVQAPRSDIRPTDVIAARSRRAERRGGLLTMLERKEPIELPAIRRHSVTEMAGTRSADVDVGLGIELTATFLHALGIPLPGAHATATLWQGATGMSFEVRDVEQHDVDVGELGDALVGSQVRRSSPAARVFFDEPKVQMFVLTRTLTSRHFGVRSSVKGGQSLDVKVDAISEVIGAADAKVEWHKESTDVVRFEGDEPVTFAFAAVPCVMTSDGMFYFGLEADQLTLGETERHVAAPAPIFDADGLLELDGD